MIGLPYLTEGIFAVEEKDWPWWHDIRDVMLCIPQQSTHCKHLQSIIVMGAVRMNQKGASWP